MKANEFRDLTVNELETKVRSLKADLFSQRFKLATGQLENTNQIRQIRRDIARALTVLKESQEKAQKNA